jgi:hypothetical protein
MNPLANSEKKFSGMAQAPENSVKSCSSSTPPKKEPKRLKLSERYVDEAGHLRIRYFDPHTGLPVESATSLATPKVEEPIRAKPTRLILTTKPAKSRLPVEPLTPSSLLLGIPAGSGPPRSYFQNVVVTAPTPPSTKHREVQRRAYPATTINFDQALSAVGYQQAINLATESLFSRLLNACCADFGDDLRIGLQASSYINNTIITVQPNPTAYAPPSVTSRSANSVPGGSSNPSPYPSKSTTNPEPLLSLPKSTLDSLSASKALYDFEAQANIKSEFSAKPLPAVHHDTSNSTPACPKNAQGRTPLPPLKPRQPGWNREQELAKTEASRTSRTKSVSFSYDAESTKLISPFSPTFPLCPRRRPAIPRLYQTCPR